MMSAKASKLKLRITVADQTDWKTKMSRSRRIDDKKAHQLSTEPDQKPKYYRFS